MNLLSFATRACGRKCADSPSPGVHRAVRRALGALVLITAASPAGAQTMAPPANITQIRTGWNLDSFAVVTNAPIKNPFGCPTVDGYVSTKPAPGFGTFYDAAKLAFETNTRVVVTVDNTACSTGRPKIIGINVLH
jgi:hypothetical protein